MPSLYANNDTKEIDFDDEKVIIRKITGEEYMDIINSLDVQDPSDLDQGQHAKKLIPLAVEEPEDIDVDNLSMEGMVTLLQEIQEFNGLGDMGESVPR